MSFGVGDQVVCVDDRPSEDGFVVPLTRGAIYTISGFNPDSCTDVPGVRLVEVNLPKRPGYFPHYFRADRFRPVRKTDISIFTSMLKREHEKV